MLHLIVVTGLGLGAFLMFVVVAGVFVIAFSERGS